MKLKPIGNRLIIKVFEGALTTEGGLQLSNSQSNNAPVRGTVIRAGKESNFKEGDEIYFRRFAIDELKFTTEEGEQVVHVIDEIDVLALEESEPEPKKPNAREEKVAANKSGVSPRNQKKDEKGKN